MDNLYQGIFWIICSYDAANSPILENPQFLPFKVPCDANGTILAYDSQHIQLNSKSGKSFNHQLQWRTLPKKITSGHSYQYYPRGRVEIKHQTAVIYMNPVIYTESILSGIKQIFGLTNKELRHIQVKCDGSSHYHCYYDDPAIS